MYSSMNADMARALCWITIVAATVVTGINADTSKNIQIHFINNFVCPNL